MGEMAFQTRGLRRGRKRRSYPERPPRALMHPCAIIQAKLAVRSPDTDPAADRAQLALFRRATPETRAALCLSLSGTAIELSRRAVREANPTETSDELSVRWVALCYGKALADGLRRFLSARSNRRA